MPRLCSIPQCLDQQIYRRWLKGASAQNILDWINRTNHRRSVPVQTSVTSIGRLFDRFLEADALLSVGAAQRRLQCEAFPMVEELFKILEGFKQSVIDAGTLDDTPQARIRHQERLRSLKGQEVALHRALKAAGVTGPASAELMERFEQQETDDETEWRAIRDRMKERFAPQLARARRQSPNLSPDEIIDQVFGRDFRDEEEELALAGAATPATEAAENVPVSSDESASETEESKRGAVAETESAEPAPEPHEAPREPSRNAPCSCGSGRKYKKCHGADSTRGVGQASSPSDGNAQGAAPGTTG